MINTTMKCRNSTGGRDRSRFFYSDRPGLVSDRPRLQAAAVRDLQRVFLYTEYGRRRSWLQRWQTIAGRDSVEISAKICRISGDGRP